MLKGMNWQSLYLYNQSDKIKPVTAHMKAKHKSINLYICTFNKI